MYLIDNGFMQCYAQQENRGQKFEAILYTDFQKKLPHVGFVKEPFEIDFTDGETNWQVCWNLTEENWGRESTFARAKQKNVLITRYIHKFSDTRLIMQDWKQALEVERYF
ncbi:MAG: hypothetical protein LBD75_04645 [Candidatus Peribacteria bacterium]|jgi:hypothetical protein|nr:hypothetical protein [Candidatus Peribacteria bacterium]